MNFAERLRTHFRGASLHGLIFFTLRASMDVRQSLHENYLPRRKVKFPVRDIDRAAKATMMTRMRLGPHLRMNVSLQNQWSKAAETGARLHELDTKHVTCSLSMSFPYVMRYNVSDASTHHGKSTSWSRVREQLLCYGMVHAPCGAISLYESREHNQLHRKMQQILGDMQQRVCKECFAMKNHRIHISRV